MRESVFIQLRSYVHTQHNSNFHFDKLSWATKIWIKCLCTVIDNRLKVIEVRQTEIENHLLEE